MYKIGIIGDRASVLGFMALGFAVFEANTPEEAATVLAREVASGEFGVLFLTEELALPMADTLAKYKELPLPAITVIPGKDGGNGFGLATIKDATIRAVGADIVFRDEK